MNMGVLLLDNELGNPAERIEAAIARLSDALAVYTPQSFPERRARVMLNLGIAYFSRIRGDGVENIEQAIAAYQSALRHYTRQSDPVKWASAQNNLGIALRKRTRGERGANLAAAAAAHEAALECLHAVGLSVDASAIESARRRCGGGPWRLGGSKTSLPQGDRVFTPAVCRGAQPSRG